MEPNDQRESAEDLSIEFLHQGESFEEPAHLRVTTRILQSVSTDGGSGNNEAHSIGLIALVGVLDFFSSRDEAIRAAVDIAREKGQPRTTS